MSEGSNSRKPYTVEDVRTIVYFIYEKVVLEGKYLSEALDLAATEFGRTHKGLRNKWEREWRSKVKVLIGREDGTSLLGCCYSNVGRQAKKRNYTKAEAILFLETVKDFIIVRRESLWKCVEYLSRKGMGRSRQSLLLFWRNTCRGQLQEVMNGTTKMDNITSQEAGEILKVIYSRNSNKERRTA